MTPKRIMLSAGERQTSANIWPLKLVNGCEPYASYDRLKTMNITVQEDMATLVLRRRRPGAWLRPASSWPSTLTRH